MQKTLRLPVVLLSLYFLYIAADNFEEQKYGVKYASNCEVCKLLATELEAKLEETGKLGGLIETGYQLDRRLKERKEYKNSQLRLIESMESVCEGILRYNVHKERKDSTRFAKGQSQTFSTLHGLVSKGVKVDLGIPYEMWDNPSAEITQLKTQCEDMLEKFEADIEDWYEERQGEVSLQDFLCKNVVLKHEDASCLKERVDEGESVSQKRSASKKHTEL